jgi:hypothetical protein
LTSKTPLKKQNNAREKNNALEAFIYKASRASKKVALKIVLKMLFYVNVLK